MDIKYLDFEEAVDDLGLAVGGTGELVADLVVQQRLQTGFIWSLSYFVVVVAVYHVTIAAIGHGLKFRPIKFSEYNFLCISIVLLFFPYSLI